MKTVMVFGTFDFLHAGHFSVFKQAKKYGEHLIVVIGRDVTVTKVKGKSPIHSERERKEMVEHIDYVDEVLLGSRSNVYKIILKKRPHTIAIGYDQVAFVDDLKDNLLKLGLKITVIKLKPYQAKKLKSSYAPKKIAYRDHQSGKGKRD